VSITQAAGPIALVIALLSPACADAPARRTLIERTKVAMGSELRLAAWAADETATLAAFDGVFREFERLEGLLTVWRADSDVARMNAMAGKQAVKVSADTIAVLAVAAEAGGWTGGKFDITFGALADVWKFDHDQDNTVPDRKAIDLRLPLVDYTAVTFDRAAGTAFITKPGARVHLGGIGKGYAVDRAVALLKARGLTDFLIQSGGDLYVAGRNGAEPWKLGIADPRGDHRPFATLQLGDGTFSTSGDYERSFIKDGVRYHHLIDPDSGEPARGCRSVTIITKRAVTADVLSTGVFIMGPGAGMALVEQLPDVEGVIVTASNEVLISSGLKGRLTLLAPPTNAP
jgi:thiamine biosynthesis lipoprotein